VHAECALGLGPLALRDLAPVVDANRRDERDTVDVLDDALDVGDQIVRRALDPARIQRATQGAGESAGNRHDEMVERRRPLDLRFGLVERLDAPVETVGNGRVGERVEIGGLHAPARLLDDARSGPLHPWQISSLMKG
jgi:hypothetical protein